MGFANLCKCRSPRRDWRTALINTWKSKVVITHIYHSTLLGRIKELFPEIKCASIQNGTRWDLSAPNQLKLNLGHFFCYGDVETDIMHIARHSVEHYHPIGSEKAGVI